MIRSKNIKLLVCLDIVATLIIMSVAFAKPPVPQNDLIVDITPNSQTGYPGDTLTYNVNLKNNGTVPDILVVESITGNPQGWTIKLKDNGNVVNLPYYVPNLTSTLSPQEEYNLTLNVQVPFFASVGTVNMSFNIRSYANNSKIDSAIVSTIVATPNIIDIYDTNGISGIQKDEAINALNDYLFNNLITKDEAIAVLNAYLFG